MRRCELCEWHIFCICSSNSNVHLNPLLLTGNLLIMAHLNLEITRKCNQQCFYCFNNSTMSEKSGIISLETWQTILDMMHSSGLQSVHVTGGEPFIWSKTIDLLGYAQGIGLDTSILSNGFQIDNLAEDHAHILSNLKVAQISLDAMSPALHDARRGTEGAWQQATNAIKSLRSLDVPVEVSCVVDDNNLNELIQVGQFTQSVGASLLVRPLVATGRATTQNLSSLFEKRLDKALEELAANQVMVTSDRFSYVPTSADLDRQNWQNNILTVEPDGKFRGTQGFTHGDKVVMNVLEMLQVA
jgi:MoaA/NifB/PqqE/SkfB family radical SAM enzyme